MNGLRELLDELRAYVSSAKPEALPAFVGAVAELRALAELRLHSHDEQPRDSDGEGRWISSATAAEIADVDERTIRDWSKRKPWASRPTRRVLRINEAAFRRWLAARRH